MKRVINILNKILLYGFFVIGVAFLIFGSDKITLIVNCFGIFVISIVLAWFLKYKGVEDRYWLFINLALWLHLLGETYLYYAGPFLYDKILHILGGMLVGAIVYDYYKVNNFLKRDSIFLASLGIFGLWEIFEYSIDVAFGTLTQGVLRNGMFILSRIDDTMLDVILSSLGVLIYLFLKKEKVGKAFKKNIKKVEKKAMPFSLFFKEAVKIK